MLKHFLFSFNEDRIIESFDSFDAEVIKKAIINQLEKDPLDTVEHSKEFSKKDLKKYVGYDILNFYKNNSKRQPCKIVTRGDKEFLRPINQIMQLC